MSSGIETGRPKLEIRNPEDPLTRPPASGTLSPKGAREGLVQVKALPYVRKAHGTRAVPWAAASSAFFL